MPNTRVTHIKSGAEADFKLEYDTIYVYDEVNNQLTTVADLSSVQANQYVFFGTKSDRRIDAAEKNLSLLSIRYNAVMIKSKSLYWRLNIWLNVLFVIILLKV